MTLRPYQVHAVNEIRAAYASGTRKVLLELPTGGGKTTVFSHILKGVVDRGKRGIMVVRGRKLVEQASARLTREDVPHGILMNGYRAARNMPVYVCSIDTIGARGIYPPADLVVIDEAHQATSQRYIDLAARYPDAFFLPVTATPYPSKPLRHVADKVVSPIAMADLIAQGFLVPPRYFAPLTLDLSELKIANGDYQEKQTGQFMSRAPIVANIVAKWAKHCENRSTIVFCANVDHSRIMAESFCANGIAAEYVHAGTPDDERNAAVSRLERGEIKVIANCGILCTGVDLPFLGAIVMARPTKSTILYVQQGGRGTRPAPGKSDFILLDCANNVQEHGFLDTKRKVLLDGISKSAKNGATAPPIKTCPECYAVVAASAKTCHCGFKFVSSSEDREEIEDEMGELSISPDNPIVQRYIRGIVNEQRAKQYRKEWCYYEARRKYGKAIAAHFFPK